MAGDIRMGNFNFKNLILGFGLVFVVACNKTSFQLVDQGSQKFMSGDFFENIFKMDSSVASFDQPQLENNETQAAFQVTLADGTSVPDLKVTDFSVVENGQPITDFKLQSNSLTTKQTVDIVFAVDVTGSMSPTIESAKTRLISFVQKSRLGGTHSRMCLITFGDRTVKNCDRFYDNNPDDPATVDQVNELISEISKLKALTGSSDPGGSDLNENPMRALIDASKAPWSENSQRFVILITDDGFLYSPGNSGSVGALAPKYKEVSEAIDKSQMKVFAATPSLAGYDKPFKGEPGIVQHSQGEWFNFKDLISGKITLDTILNRILNRVQTTYLLQYTLDENSGLDLTLPLKKRKIEILLHNGTSATLTLLALQSNLPDGRKPYQKKFKLADKNIKKETVVVKVDGVVVSSGIQFTADNEIEFEKAPKAKSKIVITFAYRDLKDSLQLTPIIIKQTGVRADSIQIFLNGIEALEKDIELNQTLEGYLSVQLANSALVESDPYGIRANNGLTVKIKRK